MVWLVTVAMGVTRMRVVDWGRKSVLSYYDGSGNCGSNGYEGFENYDLIGCNGVMGGNFGLY